MSVGVRRSVSVVVVVGLALVCALLAGESARAAITHPYTGVSFGPNGTGSESFARPAGVAVDQRTGDVLVFDDGEGGRVYKFDAAGEPVDFSASGTNTIEEVGSAGAAEEEIAVDSSSGPDEGDIYVANNSVVRIYAESGAFLGELSGGEMCGVAVDPGGKVYVGIYGEGVVRRYTPSTNPVTNADETGSMGGLGGICNVAADAAGDVYAANWGGGVTKYDALQFGSLSAAGTGVDGNARTLAVDPAGSGVFADEQSQIAQYDGSVEPPALQGFTGASGAGALGESFGVAFDHASDEVYTTNEGRVEIFGPAVTVANVTTEAATGVSVSAATLNGSVEPSGTEVTSCVFEYGTEAGDLTQSVPCEPAPPYTGNSSISVSAPLTGLSLATAYHYRLVAGNAGGTFTGAETSFRTRGAAIEGELATEVRAGDASLRGQIDPAGEATTYHVEYGTTSAYGASTPANELAAGEEFVTVAEHLTGLAPDTTYHFRFVAENGAGVVDGPDVTFTTLPVLTDESISEVEAKSAVVAAQIDPGGEPTSYAVEYGTGSGYGSATASMDAGSTEGSFGVRVRLDGLQPGVTYHVRFAATRQSGPTFGEDIAFTTYTPGPGGLPDGRGYEMVTPEDDRGYVYSPFGDNSPEPGLVGLVTQIPMQASPDGSAVVYAADPTAAAGSGAIGDGTGNDYLARRSATGQWTQANVQPQGVLHAVYYAFSEDLSKGVLQSIVPLSPGVPSSYRDLYSHQLTSGEYQPFFTGTPPHRAANEFGAFIGYGGGSLGTFYAGSSADLSHQFFVANDALTSDALDGGERENNLYESTDGKLRLVNVLPDGSTEANATFGSGPIGFFNPPGVSNAISNDGSRVFWTDLNTGDLYVREEGTRTTQVDASQGSGSSGGGLYWTASRDGSKVFFTDCSRLTADSTAVSSGGCGEVDSATGLTGSDLYEYEVTSGRLRDLTVDANSADALGADVQGVAGSSEDGDYVYFVADGVLAAGAASGQPNLYLRHAGVTTLVTTLGSNEEIRGEFGTTAYGFGVFNDIQPELGHRTAVATPDGHSLTFMSKRSLTGYPNKGLWEVYVYDSDTAALSCASCNPTGELPAQPGVIDSVGGREVANLLPVSWSGVRQPRDISADGSRVFFDSTEPLVAQDTNGLLDAYEWERDGAGSCHTSGGCVYLLTAGTSPRYSFVLDASTTGDDVFVVTSAQLLPQDRGEGFDVYDARVGANRPVPPSCTGTGCQGLPAAPPSFATPPSVTYAGTGNFPPPAKTGVKSKPKTAKAKPKKKRAPKRRKTHRRKHRARGKRSGASSGKAHKNDNTGGRR